MSFFLFNKCFKYNFHYVWGYFWKFRENARNLLNKAIINMIMILLSLVMIKSLSSLILKIDFTEKTDLSWKAMGTWIKRIFKLDNLKTPSNILIFFDQFEYRIENADTNIKLFLYYIVFLFTFLPEKWLPSVAQNLSWDPRAVGLCSREPSCRS